MTRVHGRGTERLDSARVKIVEVNLEAAPRPVAVGRDRRKFTGGLMYRIDLSHGIGDTVVVPKPGEIWWISRKLGGVWTLSHRENEAEARSGGTPPPAPAGVIAAFAGVDAPLGWLVCDGTAISRTGYPDLFAVLGTSYGYGDGTYTFNLPDLRGRFPLGWVGDDTGSWTVQPEAGKAMGETGGEQGVVDHSHAIGFSRFAASGSGGGPIANLRTDLEDHSKAREAGTQLAANERMPYIVLNYIIKT